MKPGIHFIFLILLQGFAGTLQAEDPSSKKATSNKPISYAAIDQRAIKIPCIFVIGAIMAIWRLRMQVPRAVPDHLAWVGG